MQAHHEQRHQWKVALHLLGVLVNQFGKHELAVELITEALALNPNDAKAHYNLGIALKDLGRLEDAIDSYQKALAIKPNFAEAESNRGNLFQLLGRLDLCSAPRHR